MQTLLRHQRQIKGEDAKGPQDEPLQSDEMQYEREHAEQMDEAVNLLKTLANDNFQLRDILGDVEEKLHIGRRMAEEHFARGRGRELFPEDARSHFIVEQSLHGDAPLLGLSRAECTALCAAFGGNETTQHVCKATATRLLNPEDLTDLSVAACWLLRSTGGCSAVDFAVQTYARRETLPCALPTAWQNPLCLTLAPDRADLKSMTFPMGADVCRNGRGRTPDEYPVLPQPQSSLEAMSMIAAVRQAGGTAFWAWTPKKQSVAITTHWAGTDANRLVVPANNVRCILVGTVGEDPFFTQAMWARLQPCNEPLADSAVCESVMAAPPPPPTDEATMPSMPPPPPPPPPLAVQAAKAHYIQTIIYPWTNLLCNPLELVEGDTQRAACRGLLELAATPTRMGLKAEVIPLCEQDLFWHSCEGIDEADQDGFVSCKHVECADSSGLDFLTNACAEVDIQDEIDRMHNAVCGTTRPEPPAPPAPPPKPPRPPPAPSAPEFVAFRNASTELASDPDCEAVTYRECADAARLLHGQTPEVSPFVEIVVNSVCTGNEDENLGVSCFVGCALGADNFMPPQYSYLTSGADATFMSSRCADNLLHPLCLCRALPLPPPPPPLDETRPTWAGVAVGDDTTTLTVDGVGGSSLDVTRGEPTGYFQRVATGSAFPPSMIAGTVESFYCPGDHDTGAAQCSQHCAGELGFRARGFTVQGQTYGPSPPPPTPPPAPPLPPPPLPRAGFFHGANDQCTAVAADGQPVRYCADGGKGSYLPTLCPFGSQNTLCGPRENPVDELRIEADNSCGLTNGVCEDGGPNSVPAAIVKIHDDGRVQTLCALGTEYARKFKPTPLPHTHPLLPHTSLRATNRPRRCQSILRLESRNRLEERAQSCTGCQTALCGGRSSDRTSMRPSKVPRLSNRGDRQALPTLKTATTRHCRQPWLGSSTNGHQRH